MNCRRNPNRPFGNPTTPAGIIATAHAAAPFVWRKRVGEDRRIAAKHAVCGAINMQRHRLKRLLLSRRKHPPYTDAERALLHKAEASYRNTMAVLMCFNPANDVARARVKEWVVDAIETLDAMVECERDVESIRD